MKMRTGFTLLLGSLLIAAEAYSATVSIGDVPATCGNNVAVNVTIDNISEVTVIEFDVDYDETKMTFVSGAAGTLTTGFEFEAQDVLGTVTVGMASVQGVSGAGTIAVLTFAVLPGIASGSTELNVSDVTVDGANANDDDGSVIITCGASTNTLTVTRAGNGSGTVTSAPAGINCGADCQETYASGTAVTLTATPSGGSRFAAWSGDADCTDGAVTMNGARACTATFERTAPCVACQAGPTTACLMNGRFEVKVRWRNQFFNPTIEGVGKPINYAENLPEVHPTFGTISHIAFFSMFDFAPTRVELVVKLINGVGINDHFWVYAAGMVNNEYWVTVTDTGSNCRAWEAFNPHNQFSILTDQFAFPFP